MARKSSDRSKDQRVEVLAQEGLDPCVTSVGACWIRVGRWGRMRYPNDDVGPVGSLELRELFWRHRALVVTYHHLAAREQKPNAYLYLCRDPEYDIAKLSSNNRSKVRRGVRRHEVREIMPAEMLEKGYDCLSDTCGRHGLTPPSKEDFGEGFNQAMSASSFLKVFGATVNGELAAFMILRFCGPYVEIYSCGSANRHLKNYPNQALFATVLKQLLSNHNIKAVSYGLSSFQLHTSADTLHSFKLSVGFEAIPVIRKVIVHPVLKPLINRMTRFILREMDNRVHNVQFISRARTLVERLTNGDVAPFPGANSGSSIANQ